MVKKFIHGLLASSIIISIPAVGNTAMFSAPHLWILVAVGVVASLFQPEYNPFKSAPNDQDRGTAGQIIWSVYLTQCAIVIEAAYFHYPASISWGPLTSAALSLMVFGLFIRSWAFFTLGKFFTWHISTQTDQQIIKSGPYAFVRHPGYLGAYLTYTASAIFMSSWVSFGFAVIILLVAFTRRIHHEENALHSILGGQYAEYCHHVKRLFPWIW